MHNPETIKTNPDIPVLKHVLTIVFGPFFLLAGGCLYLHRQALQSSSTVMLWELLAFSLGATISIYAGARLLTGRFLPPPKFSNGKPTALDDLKYALEILYRRINTEYDTIDQRITWLLAAEAFLCGAFATVLGNSILAESGRLLMLYGIAIVAAVIAALVGTGIYLIHSYCEGLKNLRIEWEKELEKLVKIPQLGVQPKDRLHVVCHAATKALPAVVIAGWLTAILMLANGALAESRPAANRTAASIPR